MLRRGAIALAVVSLVGCGSDGASPTSTVDTTSPPSASTATVAPDPALAAIDSAVTRLLDAGSYAFEATVSLAVAGTSAETELEGWVDGPNRKLLLKSGPDQVITRVVDGVATVERDGEVTEVPLEQAGDAPSLEILRAVRQASLRSPTEVNAKLSAAALGASGFDVTGSANVVVFLTEGGDLAGYSLRASNGTWSVDARFFDIGETFVG